ncbi:protein PHLOEM PROTEIN 2-LIKE A1-like [Cornus florida]|uniref:protein PHLOEM PROTEIN 2-LIKE A1-like n=1 Tax=Cornus florida TaxID=4283 RepID=UPI00289B9EC0|nr:protein PHLOEM PROTEIN 2-LIKE A1-like [Cornus florida]
MGSGGSKDEAPQTSQEPRNTTSQSQEARDIHYKATETTTELKLPHAYEDIVKDADSPVDKSSTEKLYHQLHAGVFLNQKRKKYWVEEKSNSNCFMLFARNLSITWSDDKRYWHWPYLKETNDVFVDVAELLNVCWLEVHGKFETVKLSPGVGYEVIFVIMLKDPGDGWEVPVNIRLVLPDGKKQEHKESFKEKARGQWIEIPVGQFEMSPDKVGEIEFSLYEYEGGKWKRGLAIKGVAIRPKI